MKKLGCEYSHYEADQGYVCNTGKPQKKCKYNPPDLKKCLEDSKKTMKRREMEGQGNVV